MAIKDYLSDTVKTLTAYTITDMDATAVRLKDNENPQLLDNASRQALLTPLTSLAFNRYPDSHQQLREAIGRKHNWRSDGVVLGNGSDELILMLLLTFTKGTVLVHRPTFVMFEHLAKVTGREINALNLEPETWDIPIATAGAARAAGLVFMASPNNPTGNCYSQDRLEAVLEQTGGLVVIDEAYADYSDQNCRELLDNYPNLAIMRTFSKVGLAGLRLGYLLAQPEIVNFIDRVRLPYNVNAVVAAMGLQYLNQVNLKNIIEPVINERKILTMKLNELGFKVFPSAANFIFCQHTKAHELVQQLKNKNIWIRGWAPPLAEYCRVTVGTPEENQQLLQALVELLGRA